MSEAPWLTIIGLGEDASEGLSSASLAALAAAEIIIGPERHLGLLRKLKTELRAQQITWPVPFADGVTLLLSLRGRQVAMLASGDPFWFGAGTSVAKHLERGEWAALPAPSTFSLAASQMGWPLERTDCFGLHAAPLSRLRPALAEGAKLIVLLRNGAAVAELCTYLLALGWATSRLTILQALGGPRQRRTSCRADALPDVKFFHPLCVAIEVAGNAAPVTLASGRSDVLFDSDGTMTKRPVRALTLSALAPKPFEHLWDIGGGSGSIAIEWLLSHASLSATTIEPRPDRVDRITANAAALGVDHLEIVTGSAPEVLAQLDPPDVVFVGGGLSPALLDWLEHNLARATRLVVNAVTLESEALITSAQTRRGGELLRIELSNAQPLGAKRGWKASYPIVQWSVTL